MKVGEARGLTVVRGGRLLFEGLDLTIDKGAGLLLIGPNGAGKSSLLRAIAGLLPLADGWYGRSPVALADGSLALDRELSLGRALHFWGGPRLDNAIRAFGLSSLLDVPVRMLSTGQAQRARLVRVMASGAPLWLLDEPLNGLDRDGVAALDAAVSAHRKAGGAVVAASHTALSGQWQRIEVGG